MTTPFFRIDPLNAFPTEFSSLVTIFYDFMNAARKPGFLLRQKRYFGFIDTISVIYDIHSLVGAPKHPLLLGDRIQKRAMNQYLVVMVPFDIAVKLVQLRICVILVDTR